MLHTTAVSLQKLQETAGKSFENKTKGAYILKNIFNEEIASDKTGYI